MRRNTGSSRQLISKQALNFDTLLLIRLVAASVLFAVALIFTNMPGFLRIVFLLASVVIAGYDIASDAYSDFQERTFFSTQMVVTATTAVSFVLGFRAESVALVLLYQIGMLLISYAEEKSKLSALELMQGRSEETVEAVSKTVLSDDIGVTELERSMLYSSSFILKIAMVIGLIYAVVLPIFTNYSLLTSIHRALMIILIATPMSIVISMRTVGILGMCYAAGGGVAFNNVNTMEALAEAGTVVVDCAGVVTADAPVVEKISPDLIDENTLIAFAAHSLYYSQLPVAKAIAPLYHDEFRLELIRAFEEIPGCGVEADIGGAQVIVGIRRLFQDRGIELPDDDEVTGESYYVMISGKKVGKLVVGSGITEESENIVPAFRENGIKRCLLLSEESDAESRRIADERDFREVFSECDEEKKLDIVKDIKNSAKKALVYIYSTGVERHSAADIDIRVNTQAKYADVLASPDSVGNLPFSFAICRRVKEICIENAVFAFAIKAILIFLSLIGYCNLWFAVFMDMVAAVATILNSVRVTKQSPLSHLKSSK